MTTNTQDKVCKQQYQVMRVPPEKKTTYLVLQINTHAFFLCTEGESSKIHKTFHIYFLDHH